MLHTTDVCASGGYVYFMSGLVADLNVIHPLDCLVVAQVRAEWAQHDWYYDHGYIRYYVGGKAMFREHQYVAQAAYGIPDGYYVHHIDHKRLNNRADNLAVMSPAEHGRLHALRPRSERVRLTCPVCDAQFVTTRHRHEQRNKTYCSDLCRGIASRKVERPSRERLADLIADLNNWLALGRMFGVTDNTVRKWARSYDLL